MNFDDLPSKHWHKKSELEQTLLAGIHGAPELKADEKRKYLGIFREQVMAFLTEKQVKEPGIYTQVLQALQDSSANLLILNGTVGAIFTEKYKALAEKFKRPVKVVVGTEYSPDTGLVVASTSAVNFEKIEFEPRSARLGKLGLDEALINSAGKKICRDCLQKILSIAPSEQVNYHELGLLDRIMGDTCPAHED